MSAPIRLAASLSEKMPLEAVSVTRMRAAEPKSHVEEGPAHPAGRDKVSPDIPYQVGRAAAAVHLVQLDQIR